MFVVSNLEVHPTGYVTLRVIRTCIRTIYGSTAVWNRAILSLRAACRNMTCHDVPRRFSVELASSFSMFRLAELFHAWHRSDQIPDPHFMI